MLPRPHRLRETRAIRHIIATGSYCESSAVRIWSVPGATNQTRIACVVGRRVDTRAVRRHHYQRWLRQAAAHVLKGLPPGTPVCDMVWVAKPAISRINSLEQLVQALTPCVQRIISLKPHH